MKKFLFAVCALLVFAGVTEAWNGLAVVRVRTPVLRVRQRVAVVQRVVVVQRIAVVPVVAVERVRVAQVVTPLVQVTDLRFTTPLLSPFVYGGGQDNARLDRLERIVERLAEQQAVLIQQMRAPKP